MNSSPSSAAPRVLKGGTLADGAPAIVVPARIDADLLDNPYLHGLHADPRLVDPTLARAFDDIADAVRENAREEGFRAGYTDGMAAGRADAEVAANRERAAAAHEAERRQQALAGALDLLASAARRLQETAEDAFPTIASDTARAAFELATALIGRELQLASDPGADAVRRALESAPSNTTVVLRLNPADAAALAEVEELARGRDIEIVADPAMASGDCEADAGATHIDARLSAAVDRVRKVLAP